MSVIFKNKKFKVKILKNGNHLLDLTKKKITNISLLENLNTLIDLEELILDNNRISKIQSLDTLINLKKLSLKNNNISKIEGLNKLSKLEVLNLENNKISELEGLNNLINLKELNLWDNQIKELKGLENLTNLREFLLYGNQLHLWVKTELSPLGNIAQAAVAYCKRMVGNNYYDSDQINNYLEAKFDKIIEFIQKEDNFSFFKIIKEVYNKVLPFNITIFYNFFGNILKNYPDLFTSKFLRDYISYTSRLLLDKDLLKMEKYIINNYCAFDNEHILTYFNGDVIFKSVKIKGRIYLTDYRVIIIGTIYNKDESEDLWLWGVGLVLLDEIIDGISLVKIRKSLEHMNFSKIIPIFGYNFPIWETNNCRYTQENIRFNFTLPNKKREKQLSIAIYPKELYFGADDLSLTKSDVLSIIYKAVDNMKRE
jgi:hypothetical protein